MKKSLKLVNAFIVCFLLVGLLSSCNDDAEHYSYYTSIATVQADEDGYAKSFLLDDGTSLYVESSATSYKPKNERAIISFDVLEGKKEGFDKLIHLNGYFYDVLTKPVIYIDPEDEVLQDSIGYNKIKVFSVWAAPEYINIRFGYNRSNASKHMVNLVADSESKIQVAGEPIRLKFRHNVVEGEELYASGDLYVSFKLDDYIKENIGKTDELLFEVSWEEYNGTIKTETIKIDLPTEPVDPPIEE